MDTNEVSQNATSEVDSKIGGETVIADTQTNNQVSEQTNVEPQETNSKVEQQSTPESLESLYDFDDLKYDFSNVKNDNGENYNQTTIDFVTDVAKALKLDNDKAGQLLRTLETTYTKAQQAAVQRERTAWRTELRADPELGGENFDKTRLHLSTVMRKFGNNDVKEILNSTGLGDHPAFVRMFNAIGAAMSQEVNVVKGTKPKPKFTYDDFYYNTK